ncbi:MAG: type IV pilus modification protein PilV [Hydrogenophilales bacterium CG03_land_8_20_14_0_80_62_28]|nr:type IV pilus modification protein PilV [Betaproteobacteria bacterium]OIO79369.1 MAG: type IV pilus modification protein PilV [Hydrogenophilaceae bacterium CG1_02_62_390]PIV23318.1 MAG: type IV pilus modification protein PilV [Hydrogenophilales bacterium CG03_land_8_20_14_0_80_62_28]PIW39048.1 MAG: type IV pilus modification protein PilV [Hydrogenophilales bacterium CG15_BIG_FIL_POST_REV_8_21_14_020_62_31]PIW70799.1 MAG: type IV pilus modification protein PilV [Hydrogenophilales bacterium CG
MKQSGFTLLEVLVAMLVLSIGLLGLAGLMASGMRNNLSATHRTQATWAAYDMIDRMRANRPLALTTDYNTNMPAAAVACTTAVPAGTIQAQDIAGWENQLACTLPAGRGSITVDGATNRATIVVLWNDSRGTQGLANQQFRVESQL